MKFVNAHTHRYSSDNQVIELGSCLYGREQSHSGLYSVGIHPWDALVVSETEAIAWLEAHPDAAAVGECGYDFVRGREDFAAQQRLFELQLEYARSKNVPVITHCVKGYNELLLVLNKFPSVRVVVHGFAGSQQLAEQLVSHDITLSFGAAILQNEKLRNVLSAVPDDMLLLETDDADVDIRAIYDCLCEVKNIDLLQGKELIYKNFNKIFRL
jgi:TatD DNase family protein